MVGKAGLPAAMRTMARALSKVRSLSREFQQGVSEIMRDRRQRFLHETATICQVRARRLRGRILGTQ